MDYYTTIEKAFTETFIEELLPGILHNFANPLNGIMGRAKLMQRRIHDFVRTIEKRYPGIEQEMGAEYTKLLSDIDSINHESDRFYNMFCLTTGKLYSIGTQAVERLNLSTLIEAELAFSDFYLDFKHYVKKDVDLDKEAPELEGITAHVSMALWMILREGMKRVRQSQNLVFRIATSHDSAWLYLRMTCPGDELADIIAKMKEGLSEETPAEKREGQRNLCYALLLLQQTLAGTEITFEQGAQCLLIRIPCCSRMEERG